MPDTNIIRMDQAGLRGESPADLWRRVFSLGNVSDLAASNAAMASAAASIGLDLTSFLKNYLGSKTADPTVDNSGQPLVAGALYFNSASNAMKVYQGGVWSMVTAASSADIANSSDAAKGAALIGYKGGSLKQWLDRQEVVINLLDYGYKGDATVDGSGNITGGTDDTLAWRAAIAAAGASRLAKRILVPWGATGISRVDGQIVQNGALPGGLKFEGIGRPDSSGNYTRVQVAYTGSSVCWAINYPTGQAFAGNWAWDSLMFTATDPAGTVFSFNNPAGTGVIADGTAPWYIVSVRFINCAWQGTANVAATGDAIQIAKGFAFYMDPMCNGPRGFRRGVYLKGCDNWLIAAKLGWHDNGRHIHAEKSGTFGNVGRCTTEFFGGLLSAKAGTPAEDNYAIWDNCLGNVYETVYCEPLVNNDRGYIMYLDGENTVIHDTKLSGPAFRLGPNARFIHIKNLHSTVYNAAWLSKIDTAANVGYGSSAATDYRMHIHAAGDNSRKMVPESSRVIYNNPTAYFHDPDPRGAADHLRTSATGSHGRRWHLDTNNVWMQIGPNVTLDVDDAAASPGRAIEIAANASTQGIVAFGEWTVGKDFMPGDTVRASVCSRYTASGTTGNVLIQMTLNGTLINPPGNVNFSTSTTPSLTTISAQIPSGTAIGAVLRVQVYRALNSVSCRIFGIDVEQVSAAIAAPTGGSVIDVEARAAISSILAAMKAGVPIA